MNTKYNTIYDAPTPDEAICERQLEISREMSKLEHIIEALNHRIANTLTKKLQPLINKSKANMVRENRPDEPCCSSELGQGLQTFRSKLESLCDRIDDLVDILEI